MRVYCAHRFSQFFIVVNNRCMSKFAVIRTGGKQYLVREGDAIEVEKLAGDEGAEVTFDDVLLIADDKKKAIELGAPTLSGKAVTGRVAKQFRERKVSVVKYKAKTRYRRTRGHRQHKTKITIASIV